MGKKRKFSVYAHEVYQLTLNISLMANLQAISHTYMLEEDPVCKDVYKVHDQWLVPRSDVNVNLRNQLHFFVNIVFAQRESVTTDLFNP